MAFGLGTIMALLAAALRFGIFLVIVYFVMKKAVKDAIREVHEEKK